MKRLTLGLTATAIITLWVFTFSGCEKGDFVKQNTNNTNIIKAESSKTDSIYIVQIEKGARKEGSGANKRCNPANGSCWTWFSTESNPNATFSIWIEFEMTLRPHVTLAVAHKENASSYSFPQNIVVEFPDSCNYASNINELFDLNGMVFTIEEDLVEEDDSPLMEMLHTSSPLSYSRRNIFYY